MRLPAYLLCLLTSTLVAGDYLSHARFIKITPPGAADFYKIFGYPQHPTWRTDLYREQITIRMEMKQLSTEQKHKLNRMKDNDSMIQKAMHNKSFKDLIELTNSPTFNTSYQHYLSIRTNEMKKFDPRDEASHFGGPIFDTYKKFDATYRQEWQNFYKFLNNYDHEITIAAEAAAKENPQELIDLVIRRIRIKILNILWEAADAHAQMFFVVR